MKKEAKDLTKVSMFYDAEFLVIGGLCGVGFLGMLIYYLIGKPNFSYKMQFDLKVMTPIILGFAVYFLRRRVVDSKGVSSTYLGIKYKHISWQSLHNYSIEKVNHEFQRKCPENERNMLVFKAIPIEYGKSTTIMIPATKEARALAEKYFGPPAHVQEGISFDDGSK